MIRIDLRYLAPIVVFYLPSFMLMTLGWVAGYSTAEMREAIMVVGGAMGFMASVFTLAYYSLEARSPQWFYVRGGENK